MRSLSMGSYMLSAVTEQKAPSIHKGIHPLLKTVTSKYYWFVQNIALAEVVVGIFLIPACFLYVIYIYTLYVIRYIYYICIFYNK